jgi:hypothetical protein
MIVLMFISVMDVCLMCISGLSLFLMFISVIYVCLMCSSGLSLL